MSKRLMHSIDLNLSKEEAAALLRLLDAKLPQSLQEISHTKYSFDMRDFLRRNHAALEHVRDMLRDVCEHEGCSDVKLTLGAKEGGRHPDPPPTHPE